MADEHPTPAYLTVEQVAERLQVSRSQVYEHLHAGRLRYSKFGPKCYRVAPADLAAYEQACRVEPAQPNPVLTRLRAQRAAASR